MKLIDQAYFIVVTDSEEVISHRDHSLVVYRAKKFDFIPVKKPNSSHSVSNTNTTVGKNDEKFIIMFKKFMSEGHFYFSVTNLTVTVNERITLKNNHLNKKFLINYP